jgi:hypothetical protein
MANWANVQRLGDPSDPSWQKQNLKAIEPVPGQSWQVYAPAAPAFEGFLRDLAAAGYPLKSSGGFNYRTIRGGNKLSQHAFGTAIDLNAATNPMLGRGQAVVTDLPPNVGDLAAKHGLEWGGKWKRPDAMHFEWAGGDGGGLPTSLGAMYAQGPSAPAAARTASAGPTAPMPAPGMAAAPLGAPVAGMPAAPGGQIGALAALFMQNQQERQKRREDEQAAEQIRRAALFDTPRVFG